MLAIAVFSCGKEIPVYNGPAFARDPLPIGPLGGHIVTSNTGDDSLSVLDPAGPAPVGRISVGFSPVELEGPHHLAADPAGRFVYVNLSLAVTGSGSGPHGVHGAGNFPGYVLKLDTETGREVGRVEVDPNPGDNVLTADGQTLFVTHYDLIRWAHASHGTDPRGGDSNLIAIDTEKMFVRRRLALCPAAHGVRLAADGTAVYAACGPDMIAIVDLRDPTWPVRRVSLPDLAEGANCRRCPYGLGLAPDGTVWVSSLGASNGRGGVDVYDPGTGAFDRARTIDLPGSAMFPAFSGPASSYRVVVPEQGRTGDFIRIYDPGAPGAPPRELASLAFLARDCLNAHMSLISADGRRAHLVCEGDHRGPGSLVWLDLDPLAVSASVPIGVFPDGLALVPAPRKSP